MTNRYDTFWKRLGAGIIDGLIFMPLNLVGNWIVKSDDQNAFIAWSLFNIICWTIYVVIGHGKYGQTVGKRIVNIKVLDLNEQVTIGYKRAFYREAIWMFVDLAGIAYFIFIFSEDHNVTAQVRIDTFESFLGYISIGWLIIELITMMLNVKRRALHDYIAGSVVVDIHEIRRENLGKKQADLIASLKTD